MKRTFRHAPLPYNPPPISWCRITRSLPFDDIGYLHCTMANVQIAEPLPGLNHLTLLEAVDPVSMVTLY